MDIRIIRAATTPEYRRREYLSAAETARLVRKALARSFPKVKFYVRTKVYSGGASIRVSYDGIDHYEEPADWPQTSRLHEVYKPGRPTRGEVDAIVGSFAGSGFDGMIDLKYPKQVYLDADDRLVGGRSLGTEGSHGSHPAYDTADAGLPAGAREVHPGVDFIFVEAELPYDVRVKGAA